MRFYILCHSYHYGPIKDKNRTRIRLDTNVAPCRKQTTNIIGPLHKYKKVCLWTKALFLSGLRAWIKQGWKKRKKRDRKDRDQQAYGKKGCPTKQKIIWKTELRPPCTGEAHNAGGGMPNFCVTSPSYRMWTPISYEFSSMWTFFIIWSEVFIINTVNIVLHSLFPKKELFFKLFHL